MSNSVRGRWRMRRDSLSVYACCISAGALFKRLYTFAARWSGFAFVFAFAFAFVFAFCLCFFAFAFSLASAIR
ncbi:hypothetical protein [Paraburkholderia caribensis]|uniref:hypothetical protein n=1 Tax=Paraburkholderia caribensis TaxID=75105 RepID=UPI0012E78108|nr:hypothetical protein [Paraburkholderia caribensis]